MCSAPLGRLLLLVIAISLPRAVFAQADFQLKGYFKSLFAQSRTVLGPKVDYTVDINRLRLELRGTPVSWLDYELQYDNEALLGSYLRTDQFRQLQAQPSIGYWDLDDEYLSRHSLHMRQRIYRAILGATVGRTRLSLGRQRIAWGSGRLWNPTDLLNPYNPTQLEFQERVGVDAAQLEQSFGALSRVSAVYAPQDREPASRAVRFSANMSQTDVAVMIGKFRGWDVIGGEFSGKLRGAGIHGEAARTRPDEHRAFTRAVVGLDYAFVNTLTIGAELYWNGQGASDPKDYDFTALLAGRVQNVARRYAGGQARYEITPLLRTQNVLIWNFDDNSRFFAPSLIYSLKQNLDISAGMQLFAGPVASEYGQFENVYYASVQWFF